MTDIWLVRAINGKIRVKWREEGVQQDQDFDSEEAARAFAGSLVEFSNGDLETTCLLAARDMRENDLTLEEAQAKYFAWETFEPRSKADE
jgi:hypothetical protein